MLVKNVFQNILEKNNYLNKFYYFLKNPLKNLQILFPDTYVGAKYYFYLMKLINHYSYRKRVLLKNIFLENIKRFKIINPDFGYIKLDFRESKDLKKTIKISNDLLNRSLKNKLFSSNQKKPFLITKSINLLDKKFLPIKSFLMSPSFLAPISEYLGSFPVLWTSSIWFSPNTEFTFGRSQNYHMDNEDFKQIKCFIPLEDINIENGPLTVINAKQTKQLFEKLRKKKIIKYRHTKITDEVIYSFQNKKDEVKLTAKTGEVLFLDTSRCYHYGSRPSPKSRRLLFIQFFSINSRKINFSQNKYNQTLTTKVERELFKFYKNEEFSG